MYVTFKNIMIFDKNEYFELLELKKRYNNQRKSFFKEDFDNYRKLINYQANLSTQIYWRDRKKYVSIIKSFINDVISADDFTNEFWALWTKNRDALDTIEINFDPNPKLIGFCNIVDEIFHHCEMFEPGSEQNEEYNVIWLKNSLKKTLVKIQKYLGEVT